MKKTHCLATVMALMIAFVLMGGAAQAQCPITRTLEERIPTSLNTVETHYGICNVTGVWQDSGGAGTNYFTGGSVAADDHTINLGTSLPNTDNVYITYTGYYDFDYILDTFDEVLGEVLNDGTTNLWLNGSPPIYQSVQATPYFVGVDNDGNGINEDDHFELIARVLNQDTCSPLPSATETAIQNAYATNRGRLDDFELSVGGNGITGNINALGCNFDVDIPSVETGTTLSITDGMIEGNLICEGVLEAAVSFPIDVDIPSLWGNDGLFHDAHPHLEDSLLDIGAALMAIGDTESLNYYRVLVGRVSAAFIKELLPLLLSDLKSDQTSCSYLGTIDAVIINGLEVEIEGITATVDARIEAEDVCAALLGLTGSFDCGNGFSCQTTYLSAQFGDLNQDLFKNIESYNAAADREEFFIYESAAYPDPITISTQPAPPAGNLAFGGSHTMSVVVNQVVSEAYQYQWWTDKTGTWTQIPGATSDTYSTGALNDCADVGTYSYRVDVSDDCGTGTVQSNPVSITVDPPTLSLTQDLPATRTITYGEAAQFTVVASAYPCGALNYEWEFDDSGGWTTVGLNANTYDLPSPTFADEGDYRCTVTSADFPSVSVTSNTMTVTVELPGIVITQDLAPQNLLEGDPLLLEVAASFAVPPGDIQYDWYKDGGLIQSGVGLDTYTVAAPPGVTDADAGLYYVEMESVDYPSVTKTSSAVFVSVVGEAFRVDKFAPQTGGVEDGLTWETAFDTLQEGIDAAAGAGGGEVWVAGGPTTSPNAPYVYDEERTELWGDPVISGSLVMKDNVQMYGGFEGYHGRQETSRAQRAVRIIETIIDGSQSRTASGLPAYHVIVVGSETAPTTGVRIDGFTITGGEALGTGDPSDYHNYRGGGIYNWLSQPVIANCTIVDNIATSSGGGMANETGPPPADTYQAEARLENCVFWQNEAGGQDDAAGNPVNGGGAIWNNRAAISVQYCTVVENTITGNVVPGGGMFSYNTSPVVNSSIFWNNAGNGSVTEQQIYTKPTFGSGDDTDVSYSDVEGGYPNGSAGPNINADPVFIGTAPDFWLDPVTPSPCIDTGDPSNPAPARDLPGVPRPYTPGGTVDMGAYEYAPPPTAQCQPHSVTLSGNAGVLVPAQIYDSAASSVPGGLWKMLADDGVERAVDCTDAELSPIQVELKLIDFLGQEGTCLADVTVLDEEAPEAVAQNIDVYLDAGGQKTLDATDAENMDGGSTDNCGDLSFSLPANTYDCDDVGDSFLVTLTVTDVGGNTDTADATVTVNDDLPPVMNCANISVDLDATGNYSLDQTDLEAMLGTSSDNCEIDLTSLAADITGFTCADIAAPVSVQLSASDIHSNGPSTCTVDVTVNDVTPPGFAGTPNNLQIVYAPGLTVDAATLLAGVTAEDVCDGSVTVNVTAEDANTGLPVAVPIDPGPTPPPDYIAEYTIIYEAEDSSLNSATDDTSLLEIIYDQPPVITLNGDDPQVIECGDPYTELGATALDDEQGDMTADIDIDASAVTTNTVGIYQVTYSVEDPVSLIVVTETRDVEVVDTTPPTLALNGSPVVSLLAGETYTEEGATANDACDGNLDAQVNIADAPTNPVTTGTYVVTYTVTDGEGNPSVPAQVTRTVYVLDEYLNFVGQPGDADAYVDDDPFDLSATFAGGQDPATYEWFRVTGGTPEGLGSEPVTGNTLYLTIDPSVEGVGTYDYYVEVTDVALSDTEQSESGTVEIGEHMQLVEDIEDAEVVIGEDKTLSVVVTGGLGALSYQWMRDLDGGKVWEPVLDGGNISGANSDTLVISPFNEEDDGLYQVEVSDRYETIYSSEARMTATTGVPAAGLAGLAALALATALGGAAALRRKENR